MSNRKVIHARFHQGVYVPGAGDLGNTLPPSSKNLENLAMTIDELGLLVTFTFRGFNVEALVPSANIVIMTLAPEDKTTHMAAVAKIVKSS